MYDFYNLTTKKKNEFEITRHVAFVTIPFLCTELYISFL